MIEDLKSETRKTRKLEAQILSFRDTSRKQVIWALQTSDILH